MTSHSIERSLQTTNYACGMHVCVRDKSWQCVGATKAAQIEWATSRCKVRFLLKDTGAIHIGHQQATLANVPVNQQYEVKLQQ